MARRGGKRAGAGRPKGAASRFSEASRIKAAADGITPLEFMLAVLRDEELDRPTRMDAAKAAAPYMHSRLEAVQHSGDPENPVNMVSRIERAIIDPSSQDAEDSDAASVPSVNGEGKI